MATDSARALTRRDFLAGAGGLAAASALARPAAAQARRPITVSHSVSTFVYAQHLVAREKRFFEEEGVTVDRGFIVPGGGAKVVQALAAGQALFALGDSNHPLKISERGKERLRKYGIAPPELAKAATCPQCGSTNTEEVSRFGSTPCKAQWRCKDCLEPFDRFKCH